MRWASRSWANGCANGWRTTTGRASSRPGAGPIGYALFRDLPECVHLRHFFVAPEYRGIGLGRRAFHRLRAEFFPADKRVLVEVLTWNASGLAFWKSLGFGERYLGLQLPVASGPATT